MRASAQIIEFQLYGDQFERYVPNLVHIEQIVDRARLHNWTIAPHRHPTILQMLFIDGGSGTLIADGIETPLDIPSLVVVPCDCPHAYRFDSDARGWVLSLADALLLDSRIACLDLNRFMQGNRVLPLSLRGRGERAALIATLLEEIARRSREAEPQLDDTLCSTLALLLATAEELAGETAADGTGLLRPRTALMRRFYRLVERRFREDLKVADFAAELNTSQTTLTRACREATGKSPLQLVIERRMLEAKRSLSFTNASVKEIADDLGFSDPAYFARNFRQYAGLTASAYRRRTTRPVTATGEGAG